MTRTMYDGIDSDADVIPTNAQLVAGYIDGEYAWTTAEWARFPRSVHVRIAVRSTTNAGSVLDVERGDATPAESVDWVLLRRGAGADPTVYCNTSTWPQVVAAFAARKVALPHWWAAQYDGKAVAYPGAVAKQYVSTARWDLSVVADYWPGVDPAPKPPAPPATTEEDEDMQQIEPLKTHPGEYAYGINAAGKTHVGFVADGYNQPPAKLRVVTWNGNAPIVHEVELGGSSSTKHNSVPLTEVGGVPVNAVTIRREDGSDFPVGVYLW